MDDIDEILSEMTLEEKVQLCSGADFWHTKAVERLSLPGVMMCDGPHGLRKQEGEADHLGIHKSIETVCYPTASALAASFDIEVLSKLGEALGQECQAENVGMLLGPGLNMKRSPLCGRNFEYFSEDPYLAGKLAAAYIKSLQNKGVASCVKHFAANNQETKRMSGSSQVDERTLHEIYLPAFETAVKEGKTRSVMCAYNAINDTFCSENKELLTDILRGKWGFDGFVVTDWGASRNAVKGVKAGVDLVMPGGSEAVKQTILAAIDTGELTEAELDAAVRDIVRFVEDYRKLHVEGSTVNREDCARLAEELAAECAVLLKNDGILPLQKNSKVAFIGEFAKAPRYQGSGSSYINVPHVDGALDAASDYEVRYARGYTAKEREPEQALIDEAVALAQNSEVAVIFAGLPNEFEAEGIDRETLAMPENQNALIKAVAAVQPNTVVVLHGGAPMQLPWVDKVKAVLHMYLGGQGVGKAAVRLLYGEKNPSGKLAETWPLRLQDNPSYLNFPGTDGIVEYREGIYIGYRYYDKKEMEVLFPFGYGLSYTSFLYSDLKLDKTRMTDRESLVVSCKVKNTGSYAGKETVQLYVSEPKSNVARPARELKGFVKVELLPGEEKTVSFMLDYRSFAYYETKIHDWFVDSNEYVVEIAASSRDIRLQEVVTVESTKELPYHYTELSTIGSLLKTAKGRTLWEQMLEAQAKQGAQVEEDALGEGSGQMMQNMMFEMPLGALVGFGSISVEQLKGMLTMLNE